MSKKVNFTKVAQGGDTIFFKFDLSDESKKTFVGRFLRILPDDHHLQGIEFSTVDLNDVEKIGDINVLPTYYILVNFFKDKEVDNNTIYQIELTDVRESKKGRLFNFDILAAKLD